MSDVRVTTTGNENFVTSVDGSKIYVAGSDGQIHVYDTATGQALSDWKIGKDLGAIAISPDGTKLLVIEQTPSGVKQTSDWPSNKADVSLYKIDTATGYRETFTYHATGSDYTFADVAFSDNGHALLTENILPGWSGGSNLQTFDLSTGAFVRNGGYYSGASLTQAAGGGAVLVGELHLSSAVYNLLGSDGKVLAGNGVYENGVYGYAAGIEAFVGSGAGGRIAITTGGGLHLYDGNFKYITNIAHRYPDLGLSSGVTFDSSGTTLYAIDGAAHQIVGVSLETYIVTQRMPIGDAYAFPVLPQGDELTLLADGRTFLVATDKGIVVVDRPTDNVPSSGDDQLVGTLSDDTIAGGSGNDAIRGGAGKDLIWGNTGADRLIGDGGNDRLYGGVGNDVLYGSAGNDRLYGDAGRDLLVGGSGKDTFFFAKGDSGASAATSDVIGDFTQGLDHIDLSRIDTNAALGGSQPFLFVGEAAFSADASKVAGELRFGQQNGTTYVEGDTNHDGKADFMLVLKGTVDLTASDFLM